MAFIIGLIYPKSSKNEVPMYTIILREQVKNVYLI